MAGFFAPKKLENHTSEGSMRKGDKEKARRKKGISTLAEKKKKETVRRKSSIRPNIHLCYCLLKIFLPRHQLSQTSNSFFFFFFLTLRFIFINNDFLKHKQANINVKSRRFGIIMTPFSRQNE